MWAPRIGRPALSSLLRRALSSSNFPRPWRLLTFGCRFRFLLTFGVMRHWLSTSVDHEMMASFRHQEFCLRLPQRRTAHSRPDGNLLVATLRQHVLFSMFDQLVCHVQPAPKDARQCGQMRLSAYLLNPPVIYLSSVVIGGVIDNYKDRARGSYRRATRSSLSYSLCSFGKLPKSSFFQANPRPPICH